MKLQQDKNSENSSTKFGQKGNYEVAVSISKVFQSLLCVKGQLSLLNVAIKVPWP